VALTRTSRGWSVVSPAGVEHAAGLIEGLSLADLVAEEFGEFPDPDRSACRSARGGPSRSAPGEGSDPGDADPSSADPVAARLAELERTVRQLEHALSARVATERAIGVLAERTGTGPRQAFEALRRDSRTSGRPVAEIAREVLATLSAAADGRS
jgi:hypothetical protein